MKYGGNSIPLVYKTTLVIYRMIYLHVVKKVFDKTCINDRPPMSKVHLA